MRLCVNIDHFATLREARGGLEPDPVTAAQICELHGAEGIVCHLREDRRHINDRDLRLLRDTVKTKLDLEMAITDEILQIAIETLPDLVTFVPEKRKELIFKMQDIHYRDCPSIVLYYMTAVGAYRADYLEGFFEDTPGGLISFLNRDNFTGIRFK